ncbi:MAG: F0F1 ATP synthase subunit A [Chloroflexi bacterium]|nr:F0F1 ATP synthase subunit A [Chloroflexota bacterium]
MSNKKVGCGCIGCSIPLVVFITILVVIISLSVFGFMKGGLANRDNIDKAFINELDIKLPAEVIFNIGPLPITNTIITTWISMAILILIAFFFTRKPKLILGKMQNVMEMIIEWFFNFCKDVAGDQNARRFFPVVMTIFLLVIVNSLTNLIPGYNSISVPTTEGSVHLLRGANTDINTALSLSIISFVCVTYWGLQSQKFGFFKQFINVGRLAKGGKKLFTGKAKSALGDIGFGIIDVFVGFLELLSYLIRLISFTFRLFGNMLGGEILVLILFYLLVFVGFGGIQVIYIFEMLVGVIQGLIFGGLTLVFATLAVTPHEEEEHS